MGRASPTQTCGLTVDDRMVLTPEAWVYSSSAEHLPRNGKLRMPSNEVTC